MASSDGYILFTQTHRLYVQGVRQAIQDRLRAVFGEEWWEKGVEYALPDNQRRHLRNLIDKQPDLEPQQFIEASHFASIILHSHNTAFAGAFNDASRIREEMRFLTGVRNEWAHIHNISLSLAVQASNLMKYILASLNCDEALEIERMSNDFDLERDEVDASSLVDYIDHQDEGFPSEELTAAPLEFWRLLQSYLVVEKSVKRPEDGSSESASVVVRVRNTAPNSDDLPAVHFNQVMVSVFSGISQRIREANSASISELGDIIRRDRYNSGTGEGIQSLNDIPPGQSRVATFSIPAKRLVDVDIEIVGAIDSARLLEFRRSTSLPSEDIAPLQREFMERWDSIGTKKLVDSVLEQIGDPSPDMTIAEISRVREGIRLQPTRIEENQRELSNLRRDFGLDGESGLGHRISEIIGSLREFGRKLSSLGRGHR